MAGSWFRKFIDGFELPIKLQNETALLEAADYSEPEYEAQELETAGGEEEDDGEAADDD